MELLRKTTGDNSDKKPLFEKSRHPNKACAHKWDWVFIADEQARANIAYQMQYLEFLVNLYNDYQIYAAVESLLCKNIMVLIDSIVECALFDLVNQACAKANLQYDKKTFQTKIIQTACDLGIITKHMKDNFHNLRRVRNLLHMKGIEYAEYNAYTIDEANNYLRLLEKFRARIAAGKA